ncbi:hypothetical protein OIU77_001184 [Salix suchowensis]|uniref:Uncharacterized protein n=1 Tax=Salix suchowensis TaxID=1278906 RepID=A0ABQ8ZGE6_9ROSI|nr:hypothetical protein OIU77_001184 [Salix suchowensis]
MKSKHSTHIGAKLKFTLLFIFKAFRKSIEHRKEMGSRAVLLLIGPSPPKQKILFLSF